ncbi:MAG: PEGA domain-containing protein [Deltaproteobacteria bacterium]|nr:PEGA domain-containing protein [Deltaproteobacteria bacterium]
MRGAAWSCVLLAAVFGPPTVATAQEPAGEPAAGTPDEEEVARSEAMAEARELFERGTRLMQNENWEMALVELERSYERYPTRSALFNLAMCHKALHRYREALGRFDEWQEKFAAAATEDERARVAAAQEELREYVGFLLVETEPVGATVVIDREERLRTPLERPIVLDIGRHQLDVSLEGHVTSSRDVVIVPLETVRLAVALDPEEAATGAADGGHDSGEGPGGSEEPSDAGVDALWFWTTAGAAAAAGIGAGVAGGLALAQESDLGNLRDRCAAGDGAACDEGAAALDHYDAKLLAANVLFAAAGAFGVTALVLAFFTDFDFGGDEAPPVEVTAGPAGLDPSGSPTGFVVGVGGRF